MLKLMWKKGDKGWMVGEKKNLQLLRGLERKKKGIQTPRDFQLLITKAEEKKKIFCHILKGGGGQAIHIQGFPQRAKRMVLNL